MIGKVMEGREAIIQLTVRGAKNRRREIEAIIDTGYTGYLTLPPELITELK